MKWTIHRFDVLSGDVGQRLDQFLSNTAAGLSRTQVKKIVDLGGVHINGRRVRSCSTAIKVKDSVEVYIDHLSLVPFRLQKSDILFQDQFIIVINKPPLIETQPTHARFKGTLFEALQWYLRDPFRAHQKAEIGMVQRLDRGTSGVMVFSIHPRAHKEMTRIFLEREVKKSYLALVHGSPVEDRGEIISLLARSRKDNRVKTVLKGGKEAITRFNVLERMDDFSLLDVEILTGRSHQIRAHMSENNNPLIGDVRYGGLKAVEGLEIVRPLLHAQNISFNHPVLNHKLDFSVTVPEDMQRALNKLRK